MKIKIYLLFIIFAELTGLLSSLLTDMQGYDQINTSSLTPPAIVFPIVWSLLFALMGIGIARIRLAQPSTERTISSFIYIIQLLVNFFWSLIFFNIQAYGLALAWIILLWLLIILMIIYYSKVDRTAAVLQIPYLLWVSFATYLTYTIWTLN